MNYLQSKREMGHKPSYFFSIGVHFKIREYFCIILKYVDFYIQAPFLDQKHWNDKNKINKIHVEISCLARCWDLSWQLNAIVDKSFQTWFNVMVHHADIRTIWFVSVSHTQLNADMK